MLKLADKGRPAGYKQGGRPFEIYEEGLIYARLRTFEGTTPEAINNAKIWAFMEKINDPAFKYRIIKSGHNTHVYALVRSYAPPANVACIH